MNKKGEETGLSLGKIAGAGVKAGAVIGGAFIAGGTALLGVAKNSADAAGRINDMSQKLQMSTDGFQEWDYVLGQNSINIESMAGGVKKVVNSFDDAAAGSETAINAFGRIGLSVDDLKGKSPEDMLNMTITALQGVADPAEKAALANELLGKSGSELAPILNMTGEELEAYKGKAHELGLVMSEEAVTAGDDFGDKMDDVTSSLGMLVTKVGMELLPIVSQFLDWVIANMPMIQNVFSIVMGAISSAVTIVIDVFKTYLMPVIQSVIDYVVANWPLIQSTMQTVFDVINQIINDILKPAFDVIVGVLQTVWDLFQAAWPSIQEIVGIAFDYIKTVYDSILKPTFDFIIEIINMLKAKFDEHMPAIQAVFEAVSNAIKAAYDGIIKPAIDAAGAVIKWLYDQFIAYIQPLVASVSEWFGGILQSIKTNLEEARKAVDDAVAKIKGYFDTFVKMKEDATKVFNDLKDSITEKINLAKQAVSDAIDKIKELLNFEWTWPQVKMPTFGIAGSLNPVDWLTQGLPSLTVDWNAGGGIFDKPTIFATGAGLQGVGEAGPEAIMPLSKLQTMLDWNSDKALLQEMVNLLKDIKSKSNVIALDGDKLVGGVYDRIDEMVAFKQRENELAYGG